MSISEAWHRAVTIMPELEAKPDEKKDPQDMVRATRGDRRIRIAQRRSHGRIMEISGVKGISKDASLGWHGHVDLSRWVERTIFPVREKIYIDGDIVRVKHADIVARRRRGAQCRASHSTRPVAGRSFEPSIAQSSPRMANPIPAASSWSHSPVATSYTGAGGGAPHAN